MTPSEWIGLIGLVLAFVVAPLVATVIKVYQIGDQVVEIKENHLPHIETEIKSIWRELYKQRR